MDHDKAGHEDGARPRLTATEEELMGRARRARKIAQSAAYGGGVGAAGLGALSLLGYGLLKAEAVMARRIVGQRFDGAPDDAGTYGSGPGEPWELLLVGDSTAKGMGVEHAHQTIGATIANGVAAFSGRPVHLTNVAVIGAESLDLGRQVAEALEQVPEPDIAVVLIGANDVTHRINTAVAVRHLEMAVRRLRDAGCEVVVGTCPDLGALEPIAQPLRLLARRWSRDLAAAQTVAVVEAGGRAVSVGDLLGEDFAGAPTVMFSQDRFHPSPAGYARVAAALLPTVSAALDLFGERSRPTAPNVRRGEGVGPVAVAATAAVAQPGTEVGPAEIAGEPRGPQGRWALLLHRVRPAIPVPSREPKRPTPEPVGAAGHPTAPDTMPRDGAPAAVPADADTDDAVGQDAPGDCGP
ncbi:MAG TPA: SGNH/GDSL hydrolase family protein [Intrasporangium sp.]|uniref:SGNH/GDSL hydrolase family protein n=1 Tax=Intrasporangium sp. TaxID=1925024 RepID=UPI002D777C97|nr:SGNH/GDSL hydrolase family protein [Intrasporangium sp.]HET7400059.1 SGNH/GDSL hydrolase family protein [Intrasporangium sp.]